MGNRRQFMGWAVGAAAWGGLGATAFAQNKAQTKLRLAYALSENSHYGAGAAAFVETLGKAAPQFAVQQFPNSALGGEREVIEVIEGLQLGTIAGPKAHKAQLPGIPKKDDPPRDRDVIIGMCVGSESLWIVLSDDIADRIILLDDDRVRRNTTVDQRLALLPPHP